MKSDCGEDCPAPTAQLRKERQHSSTGVLNPLILGHRTYTVLLYVSPSRAHSAQDNASPQEHTHHADSARRGLPKPSKQKAFYLLLIHVLLVLEVIVVFPQQVDVHQFGLCSVRSIVSLYDDFEGSHLQQGPPKDTQANKGDAHTDRANSITLRHIATQTVLLR